MEMLLIVLRSDHASLKENYARLKAFSPEQLVHAYNQSYHVGIIGSKAQGLYLLAMHKVFTDTFGRSPIELIDVCIIRFSKPIVLINGQWKHIE